MKNPTHTTNDAATTLFAIGALVRAHKLPDPINITLHTNTPSILVSHHDWPAWTTAIDPDMKPAASTHGEATLLKIVAPVYGITIQLVTVDTTAQAAADTTKAPVSA